MRSRHKEAPSIIDLFSGAGGLSLGAARAGFSVRAAVETDKKAIETHIKNFPETIHLDKDISLLSGKNLLECSNLKAGELDGLIGGPPCQGFSHMGHNNVNDIRNDLFIHFFRLVSEVKPKFFLAENVPGLLNARYDKIRENALTYIKKDYMCLKPFKAVASDFGAPTTRTRYFFIGFSFNCFNTLSEEDFSALTCPEEDKTTVGKALAGLPIDIDPQWQSEDLGWRKLEKPYRKKGFFEERLYDFIPDNVGMTTALERLQNKHEVSGCLGTKHTYNVEQRYAALSPREVDHVTKSMRLDLQGFCPTLRAGTGPDKGSYQAVRPIHPTMPRVITPREAARLQGFPDWFVFHKTKWHSFRQIGNSVSPLVAEKILNVIYRSIC